MKKIFAAVLAFGLMSAANAYAGTAALKIDAPSAVNVGDTFDVEIDLTENSGFTSVDMVVEYDPSVVRATGAGSVADDTLSFVDDSENKQSIISNSLISTMTSLKPLADDKNYNGKGDGTKTAAELGIIRLSSFVTAADEDMMLKKITGTGTLCTLRFEAVGAGNARISVNNAKFATITPIESWNVSASASVSVSGSGEGKVTEAQPETTTRSASAGGSGKEKTTAKEETTSAETTTAAETETAVETTTEAAAQSAVGFNDIQDYPWAVSYINELASKGIVNGYSDGSFKPADNVKRCDFVIMLSRALGLENSGTDNFSDVPDGAYYAEAVAAAKAAGIVNGNGDGTFSPDSYITRQDMMLMAKGAVEYKGIELNSDEAVLAGFDDNENISQYARAGVAAMVNAGIVNGTGSNIEPKGNTTRAQAAVIICKILEKTEK